MAKRLAGAPFLFLLSLERSFFPPNLLCARGFSLSYPPTPTKVCTHSLI